MKKKRMPKTDSVVLEYSLPDLPTAQHKAGLAGLVFHIQSLKDRKVKQSIPEVIESSSNHAVVRFNQSQLQALWEDLYDARWVEDELKSKFPNKAPKRTKVVTVVENGKAKKEKRFIYPRCEPTGNVLRFYQSGADNPWIKLWREMLWSVLRAQPKTRTDFERRASRKPLSGVKDIWQALVRVQQTNETEVFRTEPIAGSVFIGAQAENAERVPFVGRVEHNFLLNFWQWVTPVFVPRILKNNDEFPTIQGFLLVIPEVADLKLFGDLIREYWQSLSTVMSGIRPSSSLIDVPEEGGLEFLYRLAEQRIRQTEIDAALHAVEIYHLERQGNNVRHLSARRLPVSKRMLSEYGRIRTNIASPLFKRLLIRNLLFEQPWYQGADELFATYPIEHFIHGEDTPRVRFFGNDVRVYFKNIIRDLEHEESL